MPVFRAPGVYVEEVGFRAKAIEGVGTSTAAFVGPTRRGPVGGGEPRPGAPALLSSFADFERLYGGLGDLAFGDAEAPSTNFLAHAARAFFGEGGARLYVSRVAGAGAACASVLLNAGAGTAQRVRFAARDPGRAGNGHIHLRETVPPGGQAPRLTLRFTPQRTEAEGPSEASEVHEDLGLSPDGPRWIGECFAAHLADGAAAPSQALLMELGEALTPAGLREALFAGSVVNAHGERERRWDLSGGRDGAEPRAADYAGALAELAALEAVAIVAAPGSSACGAADGAEAQAIASALIAHTEAPQAHRIAVLDTPPGWPPAEALAYRDRFDSSHAAMYCPWVVVRHPLASPGREGIPAELALPPSGFVCGIFARSDAERGVHKAPANEVVRAALRFTVDIGNAQEAGFTSGGLNALRSFSGRGHRVWGARLMSSDPEWRYVPQRRFVDYLEASIERGTRWVALEPNGERLWAQLRQSLSDFLHGEWRKGALVGGRAEEAFFVRCDRSTMGAQDLAAGRLVCLVGVATLKPAEFMIRRTVLATADAPA